MLMVQESNRDSNSPAGNGYAADPDGCGRDYFGWAELQGLGLTASELKEVLRHCYLTGLDGQPAIETSRLADVLGMLGRRDDWGCTP
jgi:hypothetical protein